jgi:hypothetical protein
MGTVMGTIFRSWRVFAAGCLLLAIPAVAAQNADNASFATDQADNSIIPAPSEEALIFTGQDERPLTPSKNGFREGVDSVVAGAKAFSSWLGPETWIALIAGFGLVGFVVRRSERVLRFEPRRDAIDRIDPPERPTAASAPDASTPPHSDSDPAPSLPQAPTE